MQQQQEAAIQLTTDKEDISDKLRYYEETLEKLRRGMLVKDFRDEFQFMNCSVVFHAVLMTIKIQSRRNKNKMQ